MGAINGFLAVLISSLPQWYCVTSMAGRLRAGEEAGLAGATQLSLLAVGSLSMALARGEGGGRARIPRPTSAPPTTERASEGTSAPTWPSSWHCSTSPSYVLRRQARPELAKKTSSSRSVLKRPSLQWRRSSSWQWHKACAAVPYASGAAPSVAVMCANACWAPAGEEHDSGKPRRPCTLTCHAPTPTSGTMHARRRLSLLSFDPGDGAAEARGVPPSPPSPSCVCAPAAVCLISGAFCRRLRRHHDVLTTSEAGQRRPAGTSGRREKHWPVEQRRDVAAAVTRQRSTQPGRGRAPRTAKTSGGAREPPGQRCSSPTSSRRSAVLLLANV